MIGQILYKLKKAIGFGLGCKKVGEGGTQGEAKSSAGQKVKTKKAGCLATAGFCNQLSKCCGLAVLSSSCHASAYSVVCVLDPGHGVGSVAVSAVDNECSTVNRSAIASHSQRDYIASS